MVRTITVKPESITGGEDVVVVPLYQGKRKLSGSTARLNRTCRSAISDALAARRFSGKSGETLLLGLSGKRVPEFVLLLGMGERRKLSPESIAGAATSAARELDKRRFRTAHVLLTDIVGDAPERFVHAFVKGAGLALYNYTLSEKSPPAPTLKRMVLLHDGDRNAVGAAVSRAQVIVEHVEIVRDFVNAPANTMTPSIMATTARELCREHGVHCKVIGAAEMEKEKMGAILGVARGSVEPPKMIVMHHNRNRKDLPQVCLVGKGVTFDAGGISIKPWSGMEEMKGDMAGGGLVISAVTAAARLDVPLQVIGIVPCVENMPDGKALKPGDVITTYSGKTIEILTTDAEGRLILADALTYAQKHFAPDVTVDFATLTGAVLIALGTRIAGVMGNDDDRIAQLVDAGRSAGEPVWQLPLDDEFYDAVKGTISDYKNYSGRNASSITAAALLGRFAGDGPWMHVDIAGTSWSSGGSNGKKGATGYGVDLALEFLNRVAAGTKS